MKSINYINYWATIHVTGALSHVINSTKVKNFHIPIVHLSDAMEGYVYTLVQRRKRYTLNALVSLGTSK